MRHASVRVSRGQLKSSNSYQVDGGHCKLLSFKAFKGEFRALRLIYSLNLVIK